MINLKLTKDQRDDLEDAVRAQMRDWRHRAGDGRYECNYCGAFKYDCTAILHTSDCSGVYLITDILSDKTAKRDQ